jgi:hypothetical protein
MIDHAPLPDDYYGNEHAEDSPLTREELERFRDEIRSALCGIEEEPEIEDIQHPAISTLSLIRYRDEDTLTVKVYLDVTEIESNPVGSLTIDQQGGETSSGEIHYLRDMGDEWWALEWAILTELVMLLDLPESPRMLAEYLVDGKKYGSCLTCSTSMPGSAEFQVTAYIPETTEKLYENADFDRARQLRIPIDGAKTSDETYSEE